MRNTGLNSIAKVVACGFALLVVGSTASANAPYKAQTMRWRQDWALNCPNGSLAGFVEATDDYYTEMASHSVLTGPSDATVYWDELTDATVTGGRDWTDNNIDSQDAVLYAGHMWYNLVNFNCVSPNCVITDYIVNLSSQSGPANSCQWNSANDLLVGNNQVEYIHWLTCDSFDPGLLWYTNARTTRLHQWHGYAGTTATGNGVQDKIDDFVDDAWDGPMAWAWILEMTSWNHWGGTADACAVPMVRGNASDIITRRDTESFNVAPYFGDPTGGHATYLYYSSCDPLYPNDIPW